MKIDDVKGEITMNENIELLTLDDMKKLIGEQMAKLIDAKDPLPDTQSIALKAIAL